MKSQKLLFPLLAIITVTAAVAFSIFLFNAEDKAPTASEVTKKSLLFVYDGENAELVPVGDSGTEFTLSVPIASKESKITWFTDRPNRDAGHMSYENFVKLFYSKTNDSFQVDPPNVAIQIGGTTLIAEMTKPEIVSGANNAESIIANFTLVSGSAKEEMDSEKSYISSHVSRSNEVKSIGSARTLERVSVFVDDMAMVTLNNITSKPIINTYYTSDPPLVAGYPPWYYLNGDFPFVLPLDAEIMNGMCQVYVNGQENPYEWFMVPLDGEGYLITDVLVDDLNAQPVSKSAPPTYENYTYTLQCDELQVLENK
jgi:hypothetical protein